MSNLKLSARPLLASCFLLMWAPIVAATESDSLASAMPTGAAFYGEVTDLDQVVDRVQSSAYLETIKSSPQWRQFQSSPQYRKAEAGRQILETQLGMDLWTAAKKLFGGRIAVALYPKSGGQPDAVVQLKVDDRAAWAEFRERLAPFLVLAEDQVRRSNSADGFETLEIGGKAYVALGADGLTASSQQDLFQASLALRKDPKQPSLKNDTSFVEMSKQMGSEHLVRVYVDSKAVSQTAGPRLGIPEKSDNPLGSLLLSGILELAARSPYLGLTLDVNDQQFVLTANVAGNTQKLGEPFQPFFSDAATPGTAAIPQAASLIGGITLFRDFAEWYRRREELLQSQVLPGFDRFESGLANLLPGKDFGEDVLPLIGKRLTFVSAPQDYKHLDGEPGLKLPGFALIVELAKPQEGADTFQLFFQTLSGILNIQAGQQGRQPWVMDSETYHGTQIAFGRYLEKPSGERLPIVYNFMPASARVEDKFIISSSLGLCRQLVDALQKPADDDGRPNRNFNLEFYFDPFVDVLQANQQFFQSRLIQQGRAAREAETQLKQLFELLRQFQSLVVNTSVKPHALQVQLVGTWK